MLSQTEIEQLVSDYPSGVVRDAFIKGFTACQQSQVSEAIPQYALQKQGGVLPSNEEVQQMGNEFSYGLGFKDTKPEFILNSGTFVAGFNRAKKLITTCQATNTQDGVKLPSEGELWQWFHMNTPSMPLGERTKAMQRLIDLLKSQYATAPPTELKELKDMSEEDRLTIAGMYGGTGLIISDDGFWQIVSKDNSVIKWFFQSQMAEWPVRIIDYLRSKNYAL